MRTYLEVTTTAGRTGEDTTSDDLPSSWYLPVDTNNQGSGGSTGRQMPEVQQCPRGVCIDRYAVATTVRFDISDSEGYLKQQIADMAAGAWNAVRDAYLEFANLSLLILGGVEVEGGVIVARGAAEIVASNGIRITGLTRHGVDRVIGDAASRAGTRPQAILDALKNPKKIVEGVDRQGRPFQVFHGENARVVVNPQTGQIVSTNPLSAAGAH